MKNINLKKFFPGLVSMIIIAGMAIQSFATNVDMAAFVHKDKYMTKYYELDWRIDDIEKRLDRLYKFTCTNIKSYGASGDDYVTSNPFYQGYSDHTYTWQSVPRVDLSEEGYLRFNTREAINAFGNHSKTDIATQTFPASLFNWRDDIELYPHTSIKYNFKRTWPNSTAFNINAAYEIVVVMGPFKKMPNITSTGSSGGAICGGRIAMSSLPGGTLTYNYNSDTEPTSWINTTGGIAATTMNNGGLSSSYKVQVDPITPESMQEVYSDHTKAGPISIIYFSSVPTDLSSYDKVWLKCTFSSAGTYETRYIDTLRLNLTTWNSK